MENKKRNSVATVLLTIVCILWMYPIVLILINSLKKEVAITTSGVFSLPTSGQQFHHCYRNHRAGDRGGGGYAGIWYH